MAGIGRALMGGGRLIMFDEPSLGLAPIMIDQIYELIDRLKASGRTILIVEEERRAHSSTAPTASILMHDGRFVWNGSGQDPMRCPEPLEAHPWRVRVWHVYKSWCLRPNPRGDVRHLSPSGFRSFTV